MEAIAKAIGVEGMPEGVGEFNMEVIALGLPRCATTSILQAFESPHLNLAPVLHGRRIVPSMDLLQLTVDIMKETDTARRHKMTRQLCSGCRCALDWPICLLAGDLMDLYPNAKFLLNHRPGPTTSRAKAWAKSFQQAIGFYGTNTYFWLGRLLKSMRVHYQMCAGSYDALARPDLKLVEPGAGFGLDWGNSEFYDRYYDWIRSEAKRREITILEWEPSMGWLPLCDFLGKQPPETGTPFPFANDSKEMKFAERVVKGVGAASWVFLGMGVYSLFRFGPPVAQWIYTMCT